MVLKITGGTCEGIEGMLTTGQGMKDKKNSAKKGYRSTQRSFSRKGCQTLLTNCLNCWETMNSSDFTLSSAN